MEQRQTHSGSPGPASLSEIYEDALGKVYHYLRGRCGSIALTEELTSATFVQAASFLTRHPETQISTGWLITIARNRLVDHWRRQAVVDRSLRLLEGGHVDSTEPWTAVLDQTRAADVMSTLAPQFRTALTLRYLDDLSVPECAEILDKSVRATESLLARARSSFRTTYEETGGNDD